MLSSLWIYFLSKSYMLSSLRRAYLSVSSSWNKFVKFFLLDDEIQLKVIRPSIWNWFHIKHMHNEWIDHSWRHPKGTSSTRRDDVLDIEQIEYIEKCLLMIRVFYVPLGNIAFLFLHLPVEGCVISAYTRRFYLWAGKVPLSCHSCCVMGPRFLQSHPNDRPIKSP